jgi:Zn-dependent alcohol dehydrogenases
VLLRVTQCGVCHTDTHLRDGGYDLGSRGKMRLADRGVTYPLVMGHEVVGVVEEVGPDAVGVGGDVRLIYPWVGCGQCHQCEAGRDNYCAAGKNLGVARHGGYADRILVPDAKYLVDITGLDPSWAATMACSGLTAYSAVNKVLPLPSDEPIVVIGAGGVGLTAVATLKALGHKRICVVDVSPRNLDIARELGASDVVQPGDKASKQIIEACGGPVEAVIDFVNNDITARAAFDALRKGGTAGASRSVRWRIGRPDRPDGVEDAHHQRQLCRYPRRVERRRRTRQARRAARHPHHRGTARRRVDQHCVGQAGTRRCPGAHRLAGAAERRVRDHRPGAVIRSSASIFKVRILR